MAFERLYNGLIASVNFVFNKENNEAKILTPLHPELIKRDEIIKKLTKSNVSKEAQISKYLAKEKEAEEDEKDEEVEQNLIKQINLERVKLNKESVGSAFSFKKLFAKIVSDKKFRDILEVTDKNDEVVFGKFGDIVSLGKGELAIVDTEGNVLSRGRNLPQIIHKPSSLLNHIKRFRIPIPFDKKMNYIPDIENMVMPEIVRNEKTGKYDVAQEYERPVYEMIQEREEIIRDKNDYIERLETENTKFRRKNNDLKRTNRVLESRTNTSETELSKVMEKSLEYDRRIGEMARKNIALTEKSAFNEELVTRLESINAQLQEKVEKLGIKSDFEKLSEEIKDQIEWAKSVLPQTQTVIQEKKEEKKENEQN